MNKNYPEKTISLYKKFSIVRIKIQSTYMHSASLIKKLDLIPINYVNDLKTYKEN